MEIPESLILLGESIEGQKSLQVEKSKLTNKMDSPPERQRKGTPRSFNTQNGDNRHWMGLPNLFTLHIVYKAEAARQR